MVAVREALMKPDTLGVVKSHETLEKIARFLTEVGATSPAGAIPLRIAVKSLLIKHKISRQHLYRILADKPGFVTVWQNEEKAIYYESELIAPAIEQGAQYYPHNTATMFSDRTAEIMAATAPPAWKLSDAAMSGRNTVVPQLNDAALLSMGPHYKDTVKPLLAGAGITNKKQYQNFISLLTTLWENGEFDGD